MTPFRYLLRVRYSECDAQGIVFNARWADYVDLAVGEFSRALFGSVDPTITGIDWKVVKQTIEWKLSARYDDILECQVSTVRVGTTSFTLATQLHRFGGPLLAMVETVYVAVDRHGNKQTVSDDYRRALERGAPEVTVDHAAALATRS